LGGAAVEALGFPRDEIFHRLRYKHGDGIFLPLYAYTNFERPEAGVAAEKAYAEEGEALCRERLYKPLGMTSTSSRYADFFARPNKALGHVLVDGKWVQKFKRDPDAQSPTGGVGSSVNDVAERVPLRVRNCKFDG